MSKKETMDEIENHYREAFADKDKDRVIPEKWFEGIKKMPEEISKTLEKKITIIEVTNALFKLVSKECHLISFSVAEKVIYMQGLHQTAPGQWL